MGLRRGLAALAAAATVAGALAAPAAAAAEPDQEVPFTCGQDWQGSTRATHRPSSLAVDFNRDRDYGQLVLASSAGVVSRVEDAGGASYGKWIRIDHAEGYSTVYAHLKAQWVVVGQFVDQGTPIGRVGNTGGVSGAHLHYEQRLGGDVVPARFHQQAFVYGSTVVSQNCPDVPLAGDWNGDLVSGVAVFHRDGRAGSFEIHSPDQTLAPVRFGRSSDLPVTGDWDGDGVTDVGVRRQGARAFILRNADGTRTRTRLGVIKDLPVTGDWDGDGRTDLGIWRPARTRFRLLRADGAVEVVPLGARGSAPLSGDWDGDGRSDVGVYDPVTATFTLRTVGADGAQSLTSVLLGRSGDLPVTGDWNGDKVTDLGVWNPVTATYTLRVSSLSAAAKRATSTVPELRTVVFGRPR